MEFERAGHAAAPTRIFDTAYRPSSVTPSGVPLSSGMTATGSHVYFLFAARGTTPRGRRFFATPGDLQKFGSLHPLSLPLQADSSPYTGEPFSLRRKCIPYSSFENQTPALPGNEVTPKS